MKEVKTCLRTPGGKFYGFKKIEKYFKCNYDEYREPFLGGASVFLSIKPADKINWVNDLDKDLYNFYNVIKNNSSKKKLYKLLQNQTVSKKKYLEILKFKPKSNIESAFKYFYLNRTSFSGIMKNPRWGYKIGSSVEPNKWVSRIETVSDKIKIAKITNLDFRKVISHNSNNNVLIYCDPPYYKVSKGIYNKEFLDKDHLDLVSLLKETKYKFILSYNYHLDLLKFYKWAKIEITTWKYFMSEGRRPVGKEIIISNF